MDLAALLSLVGSADVTSAGRTLGGALCQQQEPLQEVLFYPAMQPTRTAHQTPVALTPLGVEAPGWSVKAGLSLESSGTLVCPSG